MKTTISSALTAASREMLSSARFRTAPSWSNSMARSTLTECVPFTYIFVTGYLPSLIAERKKDKHKHIPPELHDQWERDRAKKAERKRLRELEKLAAASADFFTPTKKKKKGKKARKAARQAAAAAVSLDTVAEHMRAFVVDLGGAPMLALPPMEKRMRKLVHDLAGAFNLTSKSEGNGKARFTTLTRTTMSGVRVDERKLARILGKQAEAGWRPQRR
jgi:hypothetical protein